MLTSRPARSGKAFARLYNGCGLTQCQRVPRKVYAMFTNSFFAFTTGCDIDGWRGTDALIANRNLWRLCCQSQREIIGLGQHGLLGKLGSLLMSDSRIEKMMREMDADSEPLNMTAFNKFHHGGKVQSQDIQVMENCAAVGEAEGREMSATRALLANWREVWGEPCINSQSHSE